MTVVEEYRKGQDPDLDRDYEAAVPFGRVKVGERGLYWKHLIRWSRLSWDQVDRMWRRMEEVRSKTGCCSNDFSVHSLMVKTLDGEEIEIKIGEGLYRHEPERLMEELKNRHPEIRYGREQSPDPA